MRASPPTERQRIPAAGTDDVPAAEAVCSGVEILPIDHPLFRFLRPVE